MGSFLNALRVEQVSVEPEEWELLAPLLFSSDVLNTIIEVPAGFRTDFASVPRIPFAYWIAGGTAETAAVIHDYLYRKRKTFPDLTRAQADLVFLEAMVASGVAYWRRQAMYAAVQCFGYWAWERSGGAA